MVGQVSTMTSTFKYESWKTLAYRRATATNPETMQSIIILINWKKFWFIAHLVVAHLVLIISMKVGFHFSTVQAKE